MSQIVLESLGVTPELAAKIISYDAETGRLTWLPRPPQLFETEDPRGNEWASLSFNLRFSGREALSGIDGHGYRAGKLWGKTQRAHRVAWVLFYKQWPSGEIDHINGIRSDNRIVNLREVSRSENNKNRSANQRIRELPPGVSFKSGNRAKPYVSRIKCDGKDVHLGYFSDPADAHLAYVNAAALLGFSLRHNKFSPAQL